MERNLLHFYDFLLQHLCFPFQMEILFSEGIYQLLIIRNLKYGSP